MKWVVEGYTTILWQSRILLMLTYAIGSYHPCPCSTRQERTTDLPCCVCGTGWLRVCQFCKIVTP